MSIFSDRSPCVLIIDDDEQTLELSRRLVRQAAPTAVVLTAHGGGQGINYLMQASTVPNKSVPVPTVILLDLNMPEINGFDILRWMGQNQMLSEIKVVMLTSSQEESDMKLATELGAHGYLVKYPSVSALTGSLNGALSHFTSV